MQDLERRSAANQLKPGETLEWIPTASTGSAGKSR